MRSPPDQTRGGPIGVVGAGFAFSAVIGGLVFYSLGAYFAPLQSEFGWSFTTVSWAFALQALASGIGMVLGGPLLDRVAPRVFAIIGTLVVGCSFLALALVSSVPALFGVFMVMGLAAAPTTYILFNALLARWFSSRMGLALAIVQTGYGVGGLGVSLFVILLLNIGWRSASVVAAIIVFGVCVPVSWILSASKPGSANLDPTILPPQSTLRTTLQNRTFWVILFVLMVPLGVAQLVYTHQIRALITFGVTPRLAGLTVGIAAVAGLLGRIGLGRLADRFGSTYVLLAALVLQSVGVGLLGLVRGDDDPLIYIFATVFGAGQGGVFLLGPLIQREYFGTAQFGTVQGLLLGPTALTSAIAPLFAGAYVDRYSDYRAPLLLASALVLIAVLALAVGVRPQRTVPPLQETRQQSR